jgi:hypothetical protein
MSIPDPEEMAKRQAEEDKISQKNNPSPVETPKTEDSVFKLDSLLSNVSLISSKVVTSGLDTLEGIGKKTISIIQETDPNLKTKILTGNKQNLSDLLKEAKEKSDVPENCTANENSIASVSFEHLLDEYKGLVFLEALEILSKQSKLKIELLLKPLSGKQLAEMEETLGEVEELCELPDVDETDDLVIVSLEEKLIKATEDLSIKINFTEIVETSSDFDSWIKSNDGSDESLVYRNSFEALAKVCALSLNNYQKLAELMLALQHRSTADEADSIAQ